MLANNIRRTVETLRKLQRLSKRFNALERAVNDTVYLTVNGEGNLVRFRDIYLVWCEFHVFVFVVRYNNKESTKGIQRT